MTTSAGADPRSMPAIAEAAAEHGPAMIVQVEPATEEWLSALVDGDDAFAGRFGVAVVQGWAGFPEAVPHALAQVREHGPSAWGTHLFFDGADGSLVGFGGWKGDPIDGVAELGYAVAPARRGRGIATAVVRQLLDRAREAGLQSVVAHTVAERNPSTAVLERCGFACVADIDDEDDGPLWRWEITTGSEVDLPGDDQPRTGPSDGWP